MSAINDENIGVRTALVSSLGISDSDATKIIQLVNTVLGAKLDKLSSSFDGMRAQSLNMDEMSARLQTQLTQHASFGNLAEIGRAVVRIIAGTTAGGLLLYYGVEGALAATTLSAAALPILAALAGVVILLMLFTGTGPSDLISNAKSKIAKFLKDMNPMNKFESFSYED